MSESAAKKMKVFGWNAVKLYENYSIKELTDLSQKISSDPASLNPCHLNGTSIYIYNKKARKKLEAITWAITYHLGDKKKDNQQP